jgi:hypothetical protein
MTGETRSLCRLRHSTCLEDDLATLLAASSEGAEKDTVRVDLRRNRDHAKQSVGVVIGTGGEE